GFCTPGFVVTMHGLCEEQRNVTGQLTEDELRLGLSGNLCRCTGYSQIINAGQAFDPSTVESIADRYDTASMLSEFKSLGAEIVHVNPPTSVEANGHAIRQAPPEIYLPTTLEELLTRRADRPEATLVSGATDLGVQHNHGKISPRDILFTKSVAELNQLEVIDGNLVIGAAVTWAEIEAFSREELPEYYDIITRFGSPQIRHAGTLVGNLANASPIADSIPFHYVAESTLRLASVRGEREVPIQQFYLGYKQLDLQPDEVIVSVSTPLPKETIRLKLYKISKRRDMDISTVTLAFWLEMDGDTVREACLATGGVGPTVVRLPLAEELIEGKPLDLEAMRSAGRKAREEISPISDVRGSADYRLQLVENLFAKCYYDLSPSTRVEVA
ncbi:MAG: FAD binding domain-containing protein, partial [Lacipirellulaceae bacterium]